MQGTIVLQMTAIELKLINHIFQNQRNILTFPVGRVSASSCKVITLYCGNNGLRNFSHVSSPEHNYFNK